MAKKPVYTERVQVYLHPNVEQDRIVHDVYKAFGMEGRSAEAMRAILRAGVKAMYESGDLPQSVIDRCRLDERLAARRVGAVPPAAVYGHPMMPTAPMMPAAPIIPYDHEPAQRRQEVYEPAPTARRPVIDQVEDQPVAQAESAPTPPPAKPEPKVTSPTPAGENIPKSSLLKLMA